LAKVSCGAENIFQLQDLDFLFQTSEFPHLPWLKFLVKQKTVSAPGSGFLVLQPLNFLTFLGWKFLEVSNLQLQDLDLLL
jgi:hypothetical protein